MRPNTIQNLSAADASADQAGKPISIVQVCYVSAQVIVTGMSSGTISLEQSNDLPKNLPVDSTGAPIPVNWSNIASPVSITGAGVFLIPVIQVCANYLRAAFTHTNADAGTITVNLSTQSF